jgi:phosphocarrier protein HPr
MIKRQIKVTNGLGVHARPASKIVQAAGAFVSKITLSKESTVADGKSILHVMMLGANFGSTITISASGEDEEKAVTAITELFERKFDEE